MTTLDDLIGHLVAARKEHGNVECCLSLIHGEELSHGGKFLFAEFRNDPDGNFVQIVFQDEGKSD